MLEKLLKKSGSWDETGPGSDVVISTRVRLARNMSSVPFPHRQDDLDATVLESASRRFIRESRYGDNVYLVELERVGSNDKRFLRERNIITSELESSPNALAIIENDEHFVILVNEEDHFRIQVIRPGLQIGPCMELADRVDDELNRFVSYAWSDDLGYLGACPSNTGTGLKVSLMLHLPMVTASKKLSNIASVLKEKMVLLKGITGNGMETVGSLFYVSNNVALGLSEIDIAELMDGTADFLMGEENDARDACLADDRTRFEDRIWRSLGILRYGRSVNYIEAVEHLSNVRLGVILSVIKNIDLHRINDLMVNIQWSHLQRYAGKIFQDLSECDTYRADYLRSHLEY